MRMFQNQRRKREKGDRVLIVRFSGYPDFVWEKPHYFNTDLLLNAI
jgi:hypothetical protein